MAVDVTYTQDGRLVFGEVVCDCGIEHTQPQVDVYLDAGILKNVPAYIARRGFGKMRAGSGQYHLPLSGQRCQEVLEWAGYEVKPCVITRKGHVGPTSVPAARCC